MTFFTPSVAFAMAIAFARPASLATVPFSMTTPLLVSTSMSLSFSASSGTNCEWTFSVIQESLIAVPVLAAAFFVSCFASLASAFAPSCADANETVAASITGSANILIAVDFICQLPPRIMAAAGGRRLVNDLDRSTTPDSARGKLPEPCPLSRKKGHVGELNPRSRYLRCLRETSTGRFLEGRPSTREAVGSVRL